MIITDYSLAFVVGISSKRPFSSSTYTIKLCSLSGCSDQTVVSLQRRWSSQRVGVKASIYEIRDGFGSLLRDFELFQDSTCDLVALADLPEDGSERPHIRSNSNLFAKQLLRGCPEESSCKALAASAASLWKHTTLPCCVGDQGKPTREPA